MKVEHENFIYYAVAWVALFTLLQKIVPAMLNTFCLRWWIKLPEKKKLEIPPCLVGLCHHFMVVPFALYAIFRIHVFGDLMTDFQVGMIAPFSFAYLSVDTVFYALVEAKGGNYDYLVHHILAVWISTALGFAESDGSKALIPCILAAELSTIFFAIGWVMRSTSYKTSNWIKTLEIAFAISFFLTRVVNLPISVYNNWDAAAEIGLARYTLIPIVGLQFFWFYKIALKALGMGSKKEKEAANGEKTE